MSNTLNTDNSTNTAYTLDDIRTDNDNNTYINPMALAKFLPVISYKDNELHLEDVKASDLVKQYGTPCYVYSRPALVSTYQAYTKALTDIEHQVCYAVKACSNLAVLNTLAKVGASFDIVSIGELCRVLAAGGEASKVVYSGVGKTAKDVEFALEKGIGCFNVEALSELDVIHQVASRLSKTANISLRVNPNVDAKTHPYISTGLKENKFGIMHEDAIAAYEYANSLAGLNIVGIDCHIGSQITETQPFVDALDKVLELVAELKTKGIAIEHIDVGGGLGVQYIDEDVAPAERLMDLLVPKIKALGLKIMLEPGRSIVANAGILLTSVDVLKPSLHEDANKNFAVIDAAMNDLIRPSLYQSEMAAISADLSSYMPDVQQLPAMAWDLVGSICETGDFLAKNRLLNLQVGDLIAFTGAGAYGFTMSSNYNTRPRACEVMVDGANSQVVRKREIIEDLYRDESIW